MEVDGAQADAQLPEATRKPEEPLNSPQSALGSHADGVPEGPDSSLVAEQPTEATKILTSNDSDTPASTGKPTEVASPQVMENTEPGVQVGSQDSQRPRTPMVKEELAAPEPLPQGSSRPSPVDPQTYTHPDRPLNVTDALSYLDAVKMQFQDQPDVYNHFLDIMKEFKNELIDTPGVIKRVSHLFHGHPSLIQGFNTFLPVGYRIECGIDAQDVNVITVTTPSGTTMHSTENDQNKGPILWSTTQNDSPIHLVDSLTTAGPGTGHGADANGMLGPSSPDPRLYVADEQAMEPAVQYVQKIKQRCDPETYRQFLDILSQYHHKPETMDEQISRLFKDAPDLRSDFRVFMPERSQQLLDDDFPSGVRTETPGTEGRTRRRLETVANAAASSTGSTGSRRKRKLAESVREKEKDVSKVAPASKKLKASVGQELSINTYSARSVAGPSSPRRTQYQSSQPAPVMAHSRTAENEDMQFFDCVKRSLDNRETYNEFLKLVNLFTQGYIDTARLVKESRNFLGDTDLLRQFQNILGWDEKKEREYYLSEIEQGWMRPVIAGVRDRPSRIDMSVKYGSYRKLPPSEANVPCSGRDEMCRSVLNDEWVSHPTWSSEDSGFIAHKKNIYEEALHRSEEERHEYDFHIEAITRTIAMLEPINNKILQLGPDDRTNFKLKPNLGGAWKSIHQRVIKKIYGRETGVEVVQAMQESPVLAIPVVLQRLKQKEEEWKRAQREWNKIWREVDARNYLKSLDHQAITFKAAEKKVVTTKTFVSQIEAAREEQIAKRASLIDPLFARTRPRHQLEHVVDDVSALQDALKLTFSFLDRTQAQISFAERRRIEGFLRIFIPLFFMSDPVSFNSAFVVVQETLESEMSGEDIPDDVEVSSTGSNGSRGGRGSRKGVPGSVNGSGGISIFGGGDLRKKLLKHEQAKLTGRKTRAQEAASPSASRFASPATDNYDGRQVGSGAQSRRHSRRNNFFTNTVFYVLLRQVELLYSRLRLFKGLSAKVLTGSNGAVHSDIANSATQNGYPEHLYELLLESCERLFDNEIEQHVFEDQMRQVFGIQHAYKIFTIDKVIGAIIKQVQTVFSDPKSQELLDILKKDRALVSPTTQDHLSSRRNAEKVLGPDENLFHIDWTPETKCMTIQLLGKDDSSFDDSEVLTGRWQSYIDSYVSSDNTDGVSHSRLRRPFLQRNLPRDTREIVPLIVARPGVEIKLCVRTYRIFYVTGSEDVFWRKRPPAADLAEASRLLEIRTRLRRKWLLESSSNDS
ncbi:hypothetical protein AX17_004064 [Amanita inopinata Kibby_2008]|nr:hypothetical protein AX17_004064 [Amanita inopinata Kibby_2008]